MKKLVVEAHRIWALILAVAAALPAARGVWLNMSSSGLKCVYEDLLSNVVVMGDYYTFYGDGDVNYTANPSVTVKVLAFLSSEFLDYFLIQRERERDWFGI